MGIPTLIKTLTASDSASLAFVGGASDVVLDNTYDEYMFVFTDIGPATDNVVFQFQGSIDGGSNYNVTVTTTAFESRKDETGTYASMAYAAGDDIAQGTSGIYLASGGVGNGADESTAGILHVFQPWSTTYVKHFYSRSNMYHASNYTKDFYGAGYFNDADDDINAFSFYMSSGNFDGVIQLYGIA